MILTSTTFARMRRIDALTTLFVEARPTPSVPPVVLTPRYDATEAMMNPKTIVLAVAGIRSENPINENAALKYVRRGMLVTADSAAYPPSMPVKFISVVRIGQT